MTDIKKQDPFYIDVISDVVCPWCFLGKRRLDAALRQFPTQSIEVRWRPFQLDPSIPDGGFDRSGYLTRKFGSIDRLAEVQGRLTDIGKDVNIHFKFSEIQRAPNTIKAHRLIRWAYRFGRQDEIVESIFISYFENGLDIGDPLVLASLADLSGFNREEIYDRLVSDEDRESVAQEAHKATEIGVQGVPFFIFGGKLSVSGAEPVETLAHAIREAIAMS